MGSGPFSFLWNGAAASIVNQLVKIDTSVATGKAVIPTVANTDIVLGVVDGEGIPLTSLEPIDIDTRRWAPRLLIAKEAIAITDTLVPSATAGKCEAGDAGTERVCGYPVTPAAADNDLFWGVIVDGPVFA